MILNKYEKEIISLFRDKTLLARTSSIDKYISSYLKN